MSEGVGCCKASRLRMKTPAVVNSSAFGARLAASYNYVTLGKLPLPCDSVSPSVKWGDEYSPQKILRDERELIHKMHREPH